MPADTLLFLCVANSARSQMAEGLARNRAPPGLRIASAGSTPTKVHPCAILAMAALGLDISQQHSKSVDDLDPERVHTVITLCAEEVCPIGFGHAQRHHWPLSDPAIPMASEVEQQASFRRVRDQLQEKISEFFGEHAPS